MKFFFFTLLDCKYIDKTSLTFLSYKKTFLLVPLYGTSLFTIGILNLTSFFLFGIKESSYILLVSGICFWSGGVFVRSTFSKKTLNHYRKGRKEILDVMHTLGGLVCVLVGIIGCTYEYLFTLINDVHMNE